MSINYYTYAGDSENGIVPRRPGTDDVGRDDLINAAPISDPRKNPDANGWNQRTWQIIGLSKVSANVKLTIRFSGGVPSLHSFSTHNEAIVLGTFTVTDNGVGDTTITWPANTFPPNLVDAHGVTLNSAIGMHQANNVTNGVRVQTLDSSGSPADIDFTVEVG